MHRAVVIARLLTHGGCVEIEPMPSHRKQLDSPREPLPFKFKPALSPHSPIPRPALMERLLRAHERSVLLFQAPAGFGKTYALAEWARHARRKDRAIVWINLRPTERDAATLLRVIAQALKLARVAVMPRVAPAREPHRATKIQAWGEKLMTCIARQPKSVLLILDDFSQAESEEVNTFVQLLFEQMPRNLKLAIASRGPIRLSVARLLLEGRLERIDNAALAFSPQETRTFFGGTLSPAELKAAHEATEGWPAALRTVELCRPAWRAAQRDLDSITTFHKLFGEYAFTDVLASVDERLVNFLVTTSIVDAIEPALADAITGDGDSAQLLSSIASSHSILQSTDVERATWRIPAPLRTALRKRLETQGVQFLDTLNSRAVAWYESEGRLLDAIRHAISAGNIEAAATTLENAGPINLILREGDERIAAILRLIPEDRLTASARLSLCRVFMNYKQGFVAEARYQYEEISRRTAGFTVDREGGDNAQLATETAYVDLTMQLYERSSASSQFLQSQEQRLAAVMHTDMRLSLVMQIFVGLFFMLRGDLDLAANALEEAEKISARLASPWMMIWLRHHFGALALARGQLHDARYQLHLGLKVWRREFRHDVSYRALTYILLAEIDYEFNSLTEAQSKIDEALYSVEHVDGWYTPYASLYETASMLALHSDGPERAQALLARADGIQRVCRVLKHFLPAMRMHIAVLAKDIALAQEIADKHGLVQLWSSPASHDELSWRDWELIGFSLCRLAVQTDHLQQAIEMLDRMYQVARSSGRLRSQARVHLLRADVCRRRGEHRSTMQFFTQALEIGAAQGYVRVFLDEPERLRALLPMLNTTCGDAPPRHLLAFATRIGSALPGGPEQPKESELFSSREQEVIRELSLGHSNKLIARKLGLSEATVKFHLQKIFRKLGVRHRTSAVAKAHRRGLL